VLARERIAALEAELAEAAGAREARLEAWQAQRTACGFSRGRCGLGQDSAPCFSSHCWW
jgi:hypothetical protein